MGKWNSLALIRHGYDARNSPVTKQQNGLLTHQLIRIEVIIV